MIGPSIQVEALSLQLNRVTLLESINAEMQAGQLHAISGPNGAGKSSFIKCLLGLMPHQGSVTKHWPAGIGNTAYVPQQNAFEPSLPITIEEFMLSAMTRWPLFFKKRPEDIAKINSLLLRVGLADKRDLKLGELSGGERQRLLFAQALQRQSRFWCIDEPMTGLDPSGQALMTQEMTQLRDQGATLLVVHHDREWINQYADQHWVIDAGLKAHHLIKRNSSPSSHFDNHFLSAPDLEVCA